LGVFLVIGREALERGVEPVTFRDESVEVVADKGELGAVGTREDDLRDKAAFAKIKESEGDDSGSFIRGGCGTMNETGDIFSGPDNEDFGH